MTTSSLLQELLVDPETHEPVRRARPEELERLREAIRNGKARRRDGGEPPPEVEGAWVSREGSWIYPDVDGFSSLLVEERLELDEPL